MRLKGTVAKTALMRMENYDKNLTDLWLILMQETLTNHISKRKRRKRKEQKKKPTNVLSVSRAQCEKSVVRDRTVDVRSTLSVRDLQC